MVMPLAVPLFCFLTFSSRIGAAVAEAIGDSQTEKDGKSEQWIGRTEEFSVPLHFPHFQGGTGNDTDNASNITYVDLLGGALRAQEDQQHNRTNITIHIAEVELLDRPLLPTAVVGLFTILLGGFSCCALVCCAALARSQGRPREAARSCLAAPLLLCSGSAELPPLLEEDALKDRLRCEFYLTLWAQWLSVSLAAAYAAVRGGVPTAMLALLAGPLVMRSMYIELQGLRPPTASSGFQALPSHEAGEEAAEMPSINDREEEPKTSKTSGCCSCSWVCLVKDSAMGKLELVDAVSDGLAVASAFFISELAQERLEVSFAQSGAVVCFLARNLGIGGTMLIALLYSSCLQFFMTCTSQLSAFVFLADLAGMKTLGRQLQRQQLQETGILSLIDDADALSPDEAEALEAGAEAEFATAVANADYFSGLAKTFGEAIWQVLLQSTLMMAKGTPLLQQPLLLFSILLSCATLAQKALAMRNVVGFFYEEHGILWGLVWALPLVIILTLLILILVKLYAMEACESRMWGLTTGCLPP